MPVSTTSYKAETALEAAVLCNQQGLSYFKHIESTLQDLKGDIQHQPHEQRCSVQMMRKLITTIQEQLPCQRFWQVEIMVSVIKHIAASTRDRESGGLSVLLDNGLIETLAFAFEETSRHVSRNGREAHHEADHLIEVLFETVNDVAEYSGAARKLAVEAFCARLIKLVIDTRVFFHARMEAERTLNLLLEGCEDDDLSWVGKDPVIGKLMQHLAKFLPVVGDFEMQIAVTESLARMVTKSERKRRSPSWFPSEFISDAFLGIEDQQFDSDCRKFLNLLNENCQERSVYSFPCKKAFLGGYELRNPSEDKLSEFWVDFNAVSQSITMYVADEDAASEEEGGLWETVTFSKDKIKEYIVNDDAEGCVYLVMTLTEPASSILAFCGSENRTATIMFQPRTDLIDALAISIGVEMNSALVETPSSSRRSSVSRINVLVNRARNTSWGLSNMPQSFNDGYVDGGGSHEVHAEKATRPSEGLRVNEAKATPVRRKISIPLVPMTTPTRTSLHSASSSTVSSVDKTPQFKPTNQGFAQPRTPIGHHGSTKKVKTPLQVTVADKSSTSGTDIDLEHPKPHSSATPVKVSVTRNNIVCQSPIVQAESEGEVPRLVPDSQEGARGNSAGKHQQGAVSKKMRKDKSDASAGKRGRDSEDQTNAKLATKSSTEKKGSGDKDPGKALKEDAIAGQPKKLSGEDSSEAVAIATLPKKLSQDITEIPDTQESQNLISLDSEASQESCHSKGRKKGRKAAADPPREGSRKSTRSSKFSQMQSKEKAFELPQTLPPESKSSHGKKFKLYLETSVLMESPEREAKNEGRKTRENVRKPKRGNNVASDAITETEEHPIIASKGKTTSTKKGKKKKQQEDNTVTEKQGNKADQKGEMAPMKLKGASKKGGSEITGPLRMEDSLSQDFVVPKKTVKGKPTLGVNDLQEDQMTCHNMMYNPDPQEEEENSTSRLPHIDEKAAAQALAAENAEYCVPSSAPEEMCNLSRDREQMIPDSQPLRKSFRRSGRFPSPLLSDITEESTISKGSSGPKHAKQRQSPHASSKSDGAPELMVIKSRSKPETAKADSTSVNQEEKDPYAFVDSSTVSSLQVVSRKAHPEWMGDGRGDADNTKAAGRQGRKTAGREKIKKNMTAYNDVGVEDDSQDEFAHHSLSFGLKNKGHGKSQDKDQGKRRQSGKGLKKSPEVDGQESTGAEEDDLMTQKKPCHSSRRKMKGKLDSDDAYVQRIQKEVKEKAAFASRMQAQEEEYSDIEVARDVSHMTEAYNDTDISTFVKSVMKSLPKHRKNKDVLKNPVHREENTTTRRAKMQLDDDDEEAKQAEKNDREVSEKRARQSSPEARNRGSMSLPTGDIVQEDEQLRTKAKKKVASDAGAARKEVSKGVENKSSKKSSRKSSGKSVRGDESLTEGEMSVDEMVSAHMDCVLGSRKSDSLKKSVSKKAGEDRVKERQMVSCMDRFEVDEEILKRAEDTISRRSKMIAALEHSSVDLSDTEQDEGNDTIKTDKTGRKRSVEKNPSHTSGDTSNRAKRSSFSSIQGKQSPHVSASNKVLSSKSQKNREKCKQDRLDQSDDEEMFDYNLDLDDLRASRIKNSRARAEQKDSTKKSKLTTPKITSDNISSRSSKNRRSMKETVEQEDGQSEIAKPTAMASTVEKMEQSTAKSQVSKNGRTHFGSQIEDSDSEEIMETASTTPPDDTSTVVSVESFSNMCKDLLKSSGKGIAAGRGRRKLQKVDYRELESSYSESSDGSSLQTPGRSVKNTSCEKPTRDVYEYREETSSCCTASIIEDCVSERSWLADRPKQKVSTYSKTRKEVFGLTKITKNLDTVKKPRHKPQNANAPRKRKSQSPKEQDEEACPLYFCAEEEQDIKKAKKRSKKGNQQREQAEIDVHHEPVSKKAKSSCRRSLVECMSSMSSSISRLCDTSQDARDEDDGEGISEGTAEELQEKDSIPATPAMTLETVTSQMSAWTSPGSGTRTPRTPKQVSFVDELERLESDQEGHLELEYPFSGPSKNVRPSDSSLKRKYANLISDDDDDEEEENDSDEDVAEEEEEQEKEVGQNDKEKQHGLNLSMRQASILEPKILFRDPELIEEPVQSEHSGEDGISDQSISSSWGQNLDFPAMQMPEMFGFMRNRLKRKMMEKRNQTQQLTETAIQSTQKQMNKLFLELHKARKRSQNDFQQKLLTELVGMESSLEKLGKIQAQSEHILKQYAKKSTQHVEQHLSKVEELHTTFLEKDARLGENVVESLQQIISKDMKNMLKKMLQDMQQEQMKKTMQSLFLLR